ncbi:hypothetical protein Tco_0550734 [Tanacetum coccineum]
MLSILWFQNLMLKNNRDAHEVYIEKTIEYTDTLREFEESARTQNPSEPLLESACMFTKHVQELLVYVSQACLNSPKSSEKLVVVTSINKDKKVRFVEPVTSSSNIPKQTDSFKTKDSNKPLLTSTRVKLTTSASGSKPLGDTKNIRITRPPRSNQKNKVEDHTRKVKSSLNKTNSVSEPINNALVKNSVRNAKFESICAIYNKCTDKAKTARKRLKPGKHEHKNGRAHKKPGGSYQSQTLVNLNRLLVSGLQMFKTYDREPLSAHELLCYPTNDSEDLGKLNAKADIGPGLQVTTPATSSSGLVPNIIPQLPVAAAPRAVKITDSPVSTSIDQDALSSSIP